MPVLAMGLSRVAGRYAVAAAQIFLHCNGLEMCRAHAARSSAKVVERKSFRYRTMEQLPGHPMGTNHLATDLEESIALREARSHPIPAAIISLADKAHEPVEHAEFALAHLEGPRARSSDTSMLTLTISSGQETPMISR